MFIKKTHVDVKKLTSKIQDSKKDTASRLRHLKTILEHVDIDEAKSIFESNYSHVYFILYDTFVQAETNLRQRENLFHLVHKAHREELDGSLWLLGRILHLLPELVARRWQCHSLGRVMAKLLHHGNSAKLRREGVRFFLLWYQALCENAPPHVHQMFTELIPGLIIPQKGQIGLAETEFVANDLMNHPNMKGEMGASVFHDTGAHPVRSPEATPLLPPASNERTAAPDPRDGLEVLLDGMLRATGGLRWRDNTPQRHMRSFAFLLQRFKEVYLPLICPNFDYFTSIYEPKLDLPVMRTVSKREEVMSSCVVVLVNWVSMYTRDKISNNRIFMNIEDDLTDHANFMSNAKYIGYMQPHLIKDVLYSTRDNINFVHEVYRQAFLLNYNTRAQIGAIRTAIATYKEWMSGTPPPFLLEPEDNSGNHDLVPRNQRLRTDSYLGAITKENLLIRAGSQNVLQVFVTNTANVFMVQTAHSSVVLHSKSRETTPLDEQTDVCKSVLNIYRTMVMNTKMDAKTWEQLLLVLLQITAVILSQAPPNSKRNNLGGRLAQPVFQTLIVTWIRAHTNVPVNPGLWSKFLNVLSSLTHREELIIEWNKTMQTLTRVMARQVYNLNLQDLPLDRLAEQKGKRRRGAATQQPLESRENSSLSNVTKTEIADEATEQPYESSTTGRQRTISGTTTLNRSYSEGSLAPTRKSRARRRKTPSKVPTLPSNVESSLNKILSSVPSNLSVSTEALNISKLSQSGDGSTPLRRALSLDSIRHHPLGESTRGSRTPSPTASNGIEGGSIKDTIQIDMLAGDSSSIDTQDDSNIPSADRRSILMGGTARGWLPDVAAVMWKRMLGALGDVNKILNPKLHAQVFKHLVDITDSLIKIRQNQGISSDNQSTPNPPTLVPPIGIFSSWCYGALSLDYQYRDGKLWALQMLCSIVKYGPPLGNDQLPLFYHALHQALTGEDRAMAYTVLKYLGGPRFLSLLLPGHSLLLLDLVHASTVILTSTETNNVPRAEVTGLLSSLLCFPRTSLPKQFLQPSEPHVTLVDCPDIQEHVLNVILRCARREPTSKARCIAISALAQWVLQTLGQSHLSDKGFQQNVPYKGQRSSPGKQTPQNPRIKEAIQVILQAIQFKHRTIARVAAESLKLCADKGKQIAEIDRLPHLIVKSICIALEIQNVTHPKESDKHVLTALLLCLGEFCMSIPTKILIQSLSSDSPDNLVLIVLRILHQIGTGAQTDRIKLFTPDEDFDMTIIVDDVKLLSSNEANFQTAETTQNCINAIRLCAKTVAMHLVTNLGHFPMGIGASRLSSIVDEHDDMGLIQQSVDSTVGPRDSVDLTSQVLNASNLQMFLLNPCLVASFIELSALKLPGGGITAGLVTADRQVRVLLRDLNGKACWDASILYREPKIQITNIDNIDEKPNLQIGANQDSKYFMDKAQIAMSHHGARNFLVGASLDPLTSTVGLPLNPRQHTLRHRPPNQLPLANDLAPDLDQLDDLLQYIGHTSPECLEDPCSFLNAAAPTPLGSHLEAQTISIILNQKSLEQDFKTVQSAQNINIPVRLSREDHFSRTKNDGSRSAGNSLIKSDTQFHYCKLLFSQLGLAGWERRKRTHLLIRTDKLLRELRNLDMQRCRETHKVAVIYVASGQEDKNSIFRNSCGSSTYEMFVSALGWEVELESHNGFLGGLPRQGCGSTSPYYATPFFEVIYHVATRMPYDSSEAILNKTRHLGNDEVHIVWSEHYRDYRRDILPTEFCDVLIVIYPLKSGLFRVTVNRKPEVPWFGPLTDESIVGGACLANLVRATAINASRAKRSSLPFYQQFYEERKRSLDTIASRHKDSNTFEDFTSRVYSPLSLSHNIPANPNSSLASAMIDNSYRNQSKKWSQPQAESTKLSVRDIPNQIISAVNIDHPSPRPHRKLHPFKSAPKKHSQGNTPPESPTLPGTFTRKFK
ncbi:probable Rho GTPase-activating protein CG5521 isoform X1 [Sitodiplosis mosellana]|uniref:probable Rho GTPase-activating protein CG5521 isoform X1 n=1 Tax=Sitodiplosis mosellana TaxID=263140 RepID=UPI002443CE89|nr:probable Rho GTPase-activating protein CG5521 isoform X1 [Sitodiplosis mosellana]